MSATTKDPPARSRDEIRADQDRCEAWASRLDAAGWAAHQAGDEAKATRCLLLRRRWQDRLAAVIGERLALPPTGGYGVAGRVTAVNAAARHSRWTPRQRAAELVRLYRRDIGGRRRPRPVGDARPRRAARPRSRSVRTSPRAANAPPDGEDGEPSPGDDAPDGAPLHRVEPRPRRRGDLQHVAGLVIGALERLARAVAAAIYRARTWAYRWRRMRRAVGGAR